MLLKETEYHIFLLHSVNQKGTLHSSCENIHHVSNKLVRFCYEVATSLLPDMKGIFFTFQHLFILPIPAIPRMPKPKKIIGLID